MPINRVANANSLSKLTLTAVALCSLAVSTSAQNRPVPEIAPERGFTIPSLVQTPIVLQTQPDAACDLHAQGVSDAASTMRLYADAEGYVRVHASTKDDSQRDVRVQLDCTSASKVTTYPLHLRSGSAPTEDMPAPQTTTPTPQGARILPALTDEDAKQLSDKDLLGRGYPRRPDAVASPAHYQRWLDIVSRPMTLLPPHSVSRSDISHSVVSAEEGTTPVSGSPWSGYVAKGATGAYTGVQAEWKVPAILSGENDILTYSGFWVGIDGYHLTDLVQAGTGQDCFEINGFPFSSYYAWTEILPTQITSQLVSMSVNPGDDVLFQVFVEDGQCFFYVYDNTQHEAVSLATPLNGIYVGGSTAEWIMERPSVNNVPTELSQYITALMTNAYTFHGPETAIPSGTAATLQLTLTNGYINHPDNNTLSSVIPVLPESMIFLWSNFH